MRIANALPFGEDWQPFKVTVDGWLLEPADDDIATVYVEFKGIDGTTDTASDTIRVGASSLPPDCFSEENACTKAFGIFKGHIMSKERRFFGCREKCVFDRLICLELSRTNNGAVVLNEDY